MISNKKPIFKSPVLRRAGPVTWTVLLLCIVATLLTKAGGGSLTVKFLFYPPLIKQGEVWRIITPVFLHFKMMGSPVMHLLFNGVIWLNMAGQIEQLEKRYRIILLFFITAILSNIAAYFTYGFSFGGLSGVVYGLIGYLWMAGRKSSAYQRTMPKQMFIVFLAFMLIGYTGVFGAVANNAHTAGLIAGAAYAFLLPPRFKSV